MATHSSILASEIPWREEPGGLQSMDHKQPDMTERLNDENNPETWRIVSHHQQVDTLGKEHQLCGPSTWSLILVPPTGASFFVSQGLLYIKCRYYPHLLRSLWRVNDALYVKCFEQWLVHREPSIKVNISNTQQLLYVCWEFLYILPFPTTKANFCSNPRAWCWSWQMFLAQSCTALQQPNSRLQMPNSCCSFFMML